VEQGERVNLLAYWGVFKSQRVVVVIGVTLTLVLAGLSLVRVSPSGVALRSPRVYQANSMLLLKQATPPTKKRAPASYQPYQLGELEYMAGLYAQLAAGDVIRRMVDPTLTKPLSYQVSSFKSSTGDPLPMLYVLAFSSTPGGAASLAVRVGQALQRYIVTDQTSARIAVPMVVRPRATTATVFQGIRLTKPLMLTVLGFALTIFIAFTRYNIQLGRSSVRTEGLARVAASPLPTGPPSEGSIKAVPQVDEPAASRHTRRLAGSEHSGTSNPPLRGGTLRSPSSLPASSAPESERRTIAAEQ
jgi:hypothetical protein